MGVADNEDKWLDEFVERHSLRAQLKEDVRQDRYHEARNGPDISEIAVYGAGYALGVGLAYVLLVCVILLATLSSGVFLTWLFFGVLWPA